MAEHIFQCFRRVLTRKSVGAVITSEKLERRHTGQVSLEFATIEHMGSSYTMIIRAAPFAANRVSVVVSSNQEPFFRASFDMSKQPKLRKQALILAKKMQHKPVYDVLKE